MKNALYYEKAGQQIVRCKLCPHYCMINEGKRGACRVRKNIGGDLYTEVFEKVAAYGVDPIEKKPLYHFFPGSKVLSIGTIGCNLKCSFCQNYRISQVSPDEFDNFKLFTTEELVQIALNDEDNLGIAFTYSEPGIAYEYMYEIAKRAVNTRLKTVMVTNGYINKAPLLRLLPYIDAFNVDLKAFSENFYHKMTHARLEPVKNSIRIIASSESHLELTNLVIPGMNDDYQEFEEMVQWIAGETGKDTPLHLSRYFPAFKQNIAATPVNTLLDLFEIASRHLNYVYLGNLADNRGSSTYCGNCHQRVIIRSGYDTEVTGLDSEGNCTKCHHHIIDNI